MAMKLALCHPVLAIGCPGKDQLPAGPAYRSVEAFPPFVWPLAWLLAAASGQLIVRPSRRARSAPRAVQ